MIGGPQPRLALAQWVCYRRKPQHSEMCSNSRLRHSLYPSGQQFPSSNPPCASTMKVLAPELSWSSFPVAAAAAALLVVAVSAARLGRSKQPKSSLFVPPTTLPLLGNLLDLAKHGERIHHWIMAQCTASGGKPVVMTVPGVPPTIILSTPEQYDEVARVRFEAFGRSGFQHDLICDLVGESIFTVDGDEWKFHRRIMAGLFSQRALRGPMTAAIHKHLRAFEQLLGDHAVSKQPIDLFRGLHGFTLGAFVEIALGIDTRKLPNQQCHDFNEAFDFAQHRIAVRFFVPKWFWHLQRWLNVGEERRQSQSLKIIDGLVLRLINESMAKPRGEGKDLVSLILNHIDSEKHTIEASTVRDMIVTALVAGRDTTADTMSWFFHLVSTHVDVQDRIRAELREKLPQLFSDPEFMPNMDNIQQLPYLEATIREVLRLYPPAAYLIRQCAEDTVLDDGTFVPKGWMVGLTLFTIARRKDVWGEDAAEFKPERYLNVDKPRIMAFHVGPRTCVGRDLAMLQMRIVISTVIARFKFTEQPGIEVTYMPSATLPMKNPLLMNIERV